MEVESGSSLIGPVRANKAFRVEARGLIDRRLNEEGLLATEEAIFAGVPINVTLLFSPEQYIAAAEAYLKGLERRIEAGWTPAVASLVSLFISH